VFGSTKGLLGGTEGRPRKIQQRENKFARNEYAWLQIVAQNLENIKMTFNVLF